MTVSELIVWLQTYPPNARVVLNMGKNELANGVEVGTITPVRASKRRHSRDWTEHAVWESDYSDFYEPSEIVVNLTPGDSK